MCQENVSGDVLSFFFPDVLHLIFQTLQMTGLCPGLSPLKSLQIVMKCEILSSCCLESLPRGTLS